MKAQKLLVIAASVCLLAVFVAGFAHAEPPLPGIIADFCQETLEDTEEAAEEISEAANDLADCPQEFNQCEGGIFNDDPAACIVEFLNCMSRARRDLNQACNDFQREFERNYNDALAATRLYPPGVERRFLKWAASEASAVCFAPAEAVALLCAQVPNN